MNLYPSPSKFAFCKSQQSSVDYLTSPIFTCCLFVCLSPWWHLPLLPTFNHLSPLYDVLDHTNHIFSESLSSGDDNDRDEYLQKDKDTHTQTKTNTKCFQDPMYAIFIKSKGFKDLKYYIGCFLVMTKTKTKTRFYALLGLNIFQGWLFFTGEYFFQARLVFKEEYFSR